MSISEPSQGAELGSEAARDAVSAIVEKADERAREKAEHTAEYQAEGPSKPFLARPAVAISLMIVFAAILAVDVYLFTRPYESPTPIEVESMARVETVAVALQVEAYKQEHGRYPESLGEAGVQLDGVVYTRTSQGYVLHAKDESGVSLRADQNPEEFLDALAPIGDLP